MSCLIIVHRQTVFSMIVFGYLYVQTVFSRLCLVIYM